jgi:hypothetical protein
MSSRRTVSTNCAITATNTRPLFQMQIALPPRFVRTLVYALIAVQCASSIWRLPTQFVQSYWLVNYDAGFVRRGMSGAALKLFSNPPSITAINVATAVVAATSFIAALAVIEALLRLRSATGIYMALLLAASPFLFDQLLYHRRPDQAGLAVLVILGFVLKFGGSFRAAGLATSGVMFGFVALMHEGAFLYYGTFGIVLTLVLTEPSKRIASILLVAFPPTIAISAVVAFGSATPRQIFEYSANAPEELQGATDHFMSYMSDSLRDSIHGVAEFSHLRQAVMLTVGLVLVTVSYAWLTRIVGVEFFNRLMHEPVHIRLFGLAILAAATIATFATGKDWIRWFCTFGAAWLIATAFLILNTKTDPQTKEPSISVHALFGAVYLAALSPLAEQLSVGAIVKYWLPFT